MEGTPRHSAPEQAPPDARALVHEVKNDLSIISMGLQALRAMHTNPDQVLAILDTIEHDGLARLQESVEALVDLAIDAKD